MAGTDGYSLRRWNSGGGRASRQCRFLDASLEQFSADQVVCGAGDGVPLARRWEKRPTRCDPKCGPRVGAQAALLETDRLFTELEARALETDRPTAVLETSASIVRASARRRRVSGAGESQRGRRAALQAGALFRPVGRRVRAEHSVQRAEAGSDFEAAFTCCENPTVRLNRVNVILHESTSCCMTRTPQNSQSHDSHITLARSLHGAHVARCVLNSSNSFGDGVVRGRGVCVPGETKSLSTSTRSGVRRSAVYEFAHTQQNAFEDACRRGQAFCVTRARRFSGRWKSYRGVLHVLFILLSHLGQAELFGTCWLGHSWRNSSVCGMVVPRCPPMGESSFFPFRSWRLGEEGVVPHRVGGPL